MTNLENDLEEALSHIEGVHPERVVPYAAGLAAEVALEYIKMAYNAGAANELCLKHRGSVIEIRGQWLKENGIIE